MIVKHRQEEYLFGTSGSPRGTPATKISAFSPEDNFESFKVASHVIVRYVSTALGTAEIVFRMVG